MDMINYVVRPQLIRMLSWEIGIKTEFRVSIGKSGKYMYRWLEKEKWNAFLRTYSTLFLYTKCPSYGKMLYDIFHIKTGFFRKGAFLHD